MRAGKQSLHCFGKDMRKVMARQFQRIGLITVGHQSKLRISLNRTHDIAQFAIHPRRNRGFRKAGANRGGNIRWGGTTCNFTGRAIGKGDTDHLGHGFTCFQRR